jgi:hypothetical protein
MAHLPATAIEKLAASALLAISLALPYLVAMLLTAWLPRNGALLAALHLSLLVLGFGVERAWAHRAGDGMRTWSRRQWWLVPVYGSPGGGEMSAAFWALAAHSVYGPAIVAVATLSVVAATAPGLAGDLGVVRGSLAIAGVAAACVGSGILSAGYLLQPLSVVALSRRSLALAMLLVVVALTLFIGAPAIAFAAFRYGSAAGVRGALQLYVTLVGFEALAAVAIARVAPLSSPLHVRRILGLSFGMLLTLTCFVAALNPTAMHAISALSALAFASALVLAFSTSRDPLSRKPAGVVGAALRLIGAA